MAAMVGAFTEVTKRQGFSTFEVRAKMALTGDYVTGGVNVLRASNTLRVPTTKGPTHVDVKGKAGYVYEYDYGADKLLIRQEGAAGSPAPELAAAALPAGVTGDTIIVKMTYPKFG